ncbi:MAG: threonine--tRNA ligase [Bacteroidetes bacterium]|nr:threonine--tRNA ligase [Bacteroidota bacterium]
MRVHVLPKELFLRMLQNLLDRADTYIPEGYDPVLYKIRHSAAHIMAQAVLERFPDAKPTIGPPIEDRFYYDFEMSSPPHEEDLEWIEERMRAIIKERHPFEIREVTFDEARSLYQDNPYKLELIEELVAENGKTPLTVYQQGSFIDLCRGPHVPHTGYLKPNSVKLLTIAGAYWRGDAKRAQLTRIYGTAWKNRAQLDAYLERLEQARARDHRVLGKKLELFMFSEDVGPGLPLWLPAGATLRETLVDFLRKEQVRRGYQQILTPHIGHLDLYKTSGHYPYYSESQFPPMNSHGADGYLLKPMNCPHHILIYAHKRRSYRDLPVKLAEFGQVYRYEQTGELGGLTRVRGFTVDDAHVFCRHDQVEEEIQDAVDLALRVLAALDFKDFSVQLSLRDPENQEKYTGTEENWNNAENSMRKVVHEMNLDVSEELGDAAFYGPKIDFIVRDALGRKWQLGTVQLDYNLPDRFDLWYTGADDQRHRPAMIHRAPFGSLERFIGVLIEHCAGVFPFWLAPEQIRVLSISDRFVDYADKVYARLLEEGLRVSLDVRDEKIGYKIREAEIFKIPYMIVIGGREAEEDIVSVRARSGENLGGMALGSFLSLIHKERAPDMGRS